MSTARPVRFVVRLTVAAVLLAVGWLAYALVARLRPRITDSLMDTAIPFVGPHAAYLGAESLHPSGVVAAVGGGPLSGPKGALLPTPAPLLRPRPRVGRAPEGCPRGCAGCSRPATPWPSC